jgi:methionyl-tRNA synthetase
LVARITTLSEANLEKPIDRPDKNTLDPLWKDAVQSYQSNEALDIVWKNIQGLDQKINKTQPFKLVKSDLSAARELISDLATELYIIARHLNPFMPETAEMVKKTILENKKPPTLFPRKD